ncbi:MAG: sugar transferase, partial [Lachnospiraceae bacterium]|nr:sugar transferase [Lachnospiraceae bacterium]
KYSLDELPQFWQVLTSELSIVGPRPALWNQDDLIAERDKYGANSVKPGITGWAQVNGRDELEIDTKAWFDGEYVRQMGPLMDAKCFLATIGAVLCHDGVVEGGTGELHKADTGGLHKEGIGAMQKEGEKNGESGNGTETLVSKEKLNREIRMGAIVIGIAATAGVALLAILVRHWKRRDS